MRSSGSLSTCSKSYGPQRPSAIRCAEAIFQGRIEGWRGQLARRWWRRSMKGYRPCGPWLRHPLGQTELGQHRFHRMDIHAPRCLNIGAISSWRNDHEKAQYAWDYRWSSVIERSALLASMVAKECGPCGAT